MRVCKPLYLTLSIAMAFAVNKKVEFRVTPTELANHPHRVTAEEVSIAVTPYIDSDRAKPLFGGKANPYDEGVLPVLLMIRNESKQTISLRNMRVEFVGPNRQNLEAVPPGDVPYLRGPGAGKIQSSPIPGGTGRMKTKKLVFQAQDFIERGFAAKMLPPGEFAWGFFYFQTGMGRGSKILIHGLSQAATGKELFFFEAPLD